MQPEGLGEFIPVCSAVTDFREDQGNCLLIFSLFSNDLDEDRVVA